MDGSVPCRGRADEERDEVNVVLWTEGVLLYFSPYFSFFFSFLSFFHFPLFLFFFLLHPMNLTTSLIKENSVKVFLLIK